QVADRGVPRAHSLSGTPGSAHRIMFEIPVSNRQTCLEIDEARLREVACETLRMEQIARAEVVIGIVDDATIHTLNRTHLNHDYATDVLSFVYEGDEHVLDGEVILSAETAAREAAAFGWSPQGELTLYLVHGLLHLCGYDDQTDQDRQTMRARER